MTNEKILNKHRVFGLEGGSLDRTKESLDFSRMMSAFIKFDPGTFTFEEFEKMLFEPFYISSFKAIKEIDLGPVKAKLETDNERLISYTSKIFATASSKFKKYVDLLVEKDVLCTNQWDNRFGMCSYSISTKPSDLIIGMVRLFRPDNFIDRAFSSYLGNPGLIAQVAVRLLRSYILFNSQLYALKSIQSRRFTFGENIDPPFDTLKDFDKNIEDFSNRIQYSYLKNEPIASWSSMYSEKTKDTNMFVRSTDIESLKKEFSSFDEIRNEANRLIDPKMLEEIFVKRRIFE